MISNYNFLFSVHEITNTAKVTDMIIIVARKKQNLFPVLLTI